jgi:cellulose synthase/poly-beta-1,6-N-acetylglucosamine synthase-like glycosyltransferase
LYEQQNRKEVLEMSNPRISAKSGLPGITVVTCTNRPHFLRHMFLNYLRQKWPNKEWIIVLNLDGPYIGKFQRMASRFGNIRVYQLPGRYTLGRCLNFASERSRYAYITKMDDDEYYARDYLTEIMRSFRTSKADVVGKRTYFIHLARSRMLLQRFNPFNRFVSILAGGTISYKKRVWRKVKFLETSHGEDVYFCRDCRRKGYKLFAGSKYNFCALRRKNPNSHTWKVSDKQFIRHPQTKIIARKCVNYRKYVDRPLN